MDGQAGKGDKFRPVKKSKYDENYDLIKGFGKRKTIKITPKENKEDAAKQ